MLTRILGNTVYATSTVLAAFMAGLALGSFLAGRWVDRSRQPLAWYAGLEVGIGLAALLSLGLTQGLTPVYRGLYEVAGGSRAWLSAGQVLLALTVLLVPTALMGATLPTLCAHGVRRARAFGRCVGTLYALNTLGAVFGVLASGFVLLGEVGESRTIWVGVALNAAVAAGALALGRREAWWPLPDGIDASVACRTGLPTRPDCERTGHENRPAEPSIPSAPPSSETKEDGKAELVYPPVVRRVVVACFALSGLAALANEVVWSRMLLLLQGTAIYAFSSMLAAMLAGLGVGSWLGGRLFNRGRDPLRALARLQLALGLAGAVALYLFGWMKHGLLLPPLVLVGPLGFFGGLAFPAAARCCTTSGADAGRSVAGLYAWNTVGCIAGALLGGFVLIPLLGAGRSAGLLAGVSLLLGVVLLAIHPSQKRDGTFKHHGFRPLFGAAGRWEWGLLALSLLLLAYVGDPYSRLLRRRIVQAGYPRQTVVFHVEEAAADTTVFGGPQDRRTKRLWVNGCGMTHLGTVTKLMAHLPLWLAAEPRDVLVVCLGMGTTLRSASRHDGLDITAVELVPGVLHHFGYFHPDGPDLLSRPNIHAVVDDGRNFLLMRPREYDVITVDPAPPIHSAGTVNLYSREFFQLCRARLRPGGVVCLWVPPEGASEVKMIVRTFLDVFEHVSAWSGPVPDVGMYLIGSRRPPGDVAAKIRRGYARPAVLADLVEWDTECDRPEKVLDLYLADEQELAYFVSGSPTITDDRPYTEFPLWRSIFYAEEYQFKLYAPVLRDWLRKHAANRKTPDCDAAMRRGKR
jgi:spermidine synthase